MAFNSFFSCQLVQVITQAQRTDHTELTAIRDEQLFNYHDYFIGNN